MVLLTAYYTLSIVFICRFSHFTKYYSNRRVKTRKNHIKRETGWLRNGGEFLDVKV